MTRKSDKLKSGLESQDRFELMGFRLPSWPGFVPLGLHLFLRSEH
jgi:hypothetical protein